MYFAYFGNNVVKSHIYTVKNLLLPVPLVFPETILSGPYLRTLKLKIHLWVNT